MGHKIHPSGLRLGITQEHRSKWFATSKTYPILLQEDFKIRTFIQKKYGAAGISDVLIARKADQLELELKTDNLGRVASPIKNLLNLLCLFWVCNFLESLVIFLIGIIFCQIYQLF